MRYLGRASADKGIATWLYFFSRTPQASGQTLGAFHASELPFVFDSHSPFLNANAADHALTQTMVTYWSNFAKTGDPNGSDVPVWPAYSSADDVWLHLKHEIESIKAIRQTKLDLLTDTLEEKLALSIAQSRQTRPDPAGSDDEPVTPVLSPDL